MSLAGQFQPCLFFFFYKKISPAQKHSQANNNQQKKIKQTLNKQLKQHFLLKHTSKSVKVPCFAFWCFLWAQNLFVKKTKKA